MSDSRATDQSGDGGTATGQIADAQIAHGQIEDGGTEHGRHPVCALCQRPILPGTPQSLHHLIPKLRGGRGGPTALMHQICHNEIHASASEADLARLWNTPEALREHTRLAKFVAWIRKRPADFHSKTPGARRGWKRRG